MMTSVDEIFSERYMQMQQIEFVEALARISDKVIRSFDQDEPSDLSQTVSHNDLSFKLQ